MKFIAIVLIILLLISCSKNKHPNELHVAISAEYPPFEFIEDGKIKGFDIDLASMIANKLNRKVIFENIPFNSVLASLYSGKADMAISTITITDERIKNFAFSQPYYFAKMATIYLIDKPIIQKKQLLDKKIACQLGTTMEIWLKENGFDDNLILMDSNNQAIEALKSRHVDVVIADGIQADIFSKKNAGLAYSLIGESKDGYGIAFPKNSILTKRVDSILHQLILDGFIDKLKKKWLQ